MKRSSIDRLVLLLFIMAFFACSSEEQRLDNCDLIGNWRLQSIEFDECGSVGAGSAISSISKACIPVAEGMICTSSAWFFRESGQLTIDIIAIFRFDNDREEVTNKLDWSYMIDEGGLSICIAGECIPMSCTSNNGILQLRIEHDGCSGVITLGRNE